MNIRELSDTIPCLGEKTRIHGSWLKEKRLEVSVVRGRNKRNNHDRARRATRPRENAVASIDTLEVSLAQI